MLVAAEDTTIILLVSLTNSGAGTCDESNRHFSIESTSAPSWTQSCSAVHHRGRKSFVTPGLARRPSLRPLHHCWRMDSSRKEILRKGRSGDRANFSACPRNGPASSGSHL